jgi:protein gp37
VFDAMVGADHHGCQVLTKRADRLEQWSRARSHRRRPDHIWFGVSVESMRDRWRVDGPIARAVKPSASFSTSPQPRLVSRRPNE